MKVTGLNMIKMRPKLCQPFNPKEVMHKLSVKKINIPYIVINVFKLTESKRNSTFFVPI